jgi:hypothetical protein
VTVVSKLSLNELFRMHINNKYVPLTSIFNTKTRIGKTRKKNIGSFLAMRFPVGLSP